MNMIRRWSLILACVVALAGIAFAGNAHFVGSPTFSITGDTLTASGKVAGLGNVPQITVEVSADADCVNRGNKNPEAANKEAFAALGTFPVQNGRANFAVLLTATFSPDCAPPMRVEWSNMAILVTAQDGTALVYP
jgi:hypothetical protein